MARAPLISVIVPIHTPNHKLHQIRKALASSTHPIELIIVVNNPELVGKILPKGPNELVVYAPRKGRGFAFLKGVANVKGAITLLLHSDTIPPPGWDRVILKAMEDSGVAGGGFSIIYDTPNPYLDFICWFSNQWARITGEMYGDRAFFIRSQILERCLGALEVPILEDMRLAQCMGRHGRVVLLKENVETSAEAYRKHGLIQYIVKVWLSRLWYALGGSPFEIYSYYYSTS